MYTVFISHNSKDKPIVEPIPVRIGNSEMPAILTQNLYLDLFANGLEVTARQMMDLVKDNDTFQPMYTQVKNLTISFIKRTNQEVIIELNARYFMEPTPHFMFITPNSKDEISFSIKNEMFMRYGFSKEPLSMKVDDFSLKLNAVRIDQPNALVPGFPQQIVFKAKKDKPVIILQVLHEDKQNDWKAI